MHEGRSAGLDSIDALTSDVNLSFTAPDKIDVTHFVPATELAPYVTQIYFFRCDEPAIRDRQPAALGHLVFLLSGKGTLTVSKWHRRPSRGCNSFRSWPCRRGI